MSRQDALAGRVRPERSADSRAITVRAATRTHVGRVRSHNEDTFVLIDLDDKVASPCAQKLGPSGLLAAVCDGMGGAAAGEVASKLAADVLASQVPTTCAGRIAREQLAESLGDVVRQAGLVIHADASAHPERRGMGTTCTAALVRGNEVMVAQVGDSRAYLFRQGVLFPLTRDQNLASELVAAGIVRPENVRTCVGSNVLLQALGNTPRVNVPITVSELRRGDRLLVCSDGLHGYVQDASIERVLAAHDEPSDACDQLVALALAAGGRDNVTVVLCDLAGPGLRVPEPDDAVVCVPYCRADAPGGEDGTREHGALMARFASHTLSAMVFLFTAVLLLLCATMVALDYLKVPARGPMTLATRASGTH